MRCSPLRTLLALTMLALPHSLASSPAESDVQSVGLRAEASVVTDRWGIPHIRAESMNDLYHAWGWVAARDRLWQMTYTRAAGDGHTHRWLGNEALRVDGGSQLFRLRERANAIWARGKRTPHVRAALEHYCAGVNSYLAECRRGARPWPPELVRLRERPRDWAPEDCVLVLLGFGITLDLDLPEFAEARTVADSGAAWLRHRRRHEDRWIYDSIPDSAARRLWAGVKRVSPSPAESPAGSVTQARVPHSSHALAAIAHTLKAFPPRDADGADRASNAFVVGGARSASGKPILANDPHLGLTTPGPFHVVHVSIPGVMDAVGGSVAGLPIIATGRNTRVAWGVTALSADVVDVYVDTLSADGKRVRRHLPDGRAEWVPVVSKSYDLRYRVLGVGLPVPSLLQVRRYTPHGPVLVWDAKRRLALSARWTALEDDRISLDRLFGIERATSAREVMDCFATLVTPCFNVVVADVDGDAFYRSVGLLPVRANASRPGPLPSDGRHEWTGFVPTQQMPHWRVPPEGFVANGNNRPAGEAYPYALPRFDWPHDRARRMAQRLSGDRHITLEDAASVQNDVYSLAAERNVRGLLQCADSLYASLPSRSRAALDTLRAWDLYARRSRVAPTLYRAWFAAFQRRSRLEGVPGLALASLTEGAPELLETPAVAACSALAMALDTLSARLGPDLSRWTYGRAHQARFRHALSGLDPRARWEPPLTPQDGDNASPSVGPSRLPWSIEVVHGSVFRHVVDLSQPRVSYAVVPPWNSSAFSASGERDQLARWANHGYVPLHMDWERIDAIAFERVRLVP